MLENKLFEALLDVIPFRAYAVDINTHEMVYANKLMRENMYAPNETYCWEKVFAQESMCAWCSIKDLQTRGKNHKEKYICEFFDEADDTWLKSYDELVSWPDGREVKYSILVDISDQKEIQGSMMKSHASLAVKTKQLTNTNKNLQITKLKLQKSLNELNVEKLKAQKSTYAKSSFLANMSHEIRTPMNSIMGMIHLLKQTPNLDEAQKEYISKIESASANLLEIINDILDFSKIEAGKLSIENISFDLDECLRNIKNIIEIKAVKKGLEFEIALKSENKIFFGDPLRLAQVLVNLLDNAVKFTSKGKVSLLIEPLNNTRVKFKVKDTGIGINKKRALELFEPFSQADGSTTRQYGGTGLGLAITKELVSLMNGEIYLESIEGQGSEFIFEIDLKLGDEKDISTFNQEKNLKILKNKLLKKDDLNILIAEDNEINMEIICSFLNSAGIKVDTAIDGFKATEKFEQNLNKYDLVFLDIQMPKMNGLEVAKQLRKKDKDIPIIALSANVMQESIDEAKESGMNDHISKPINIHTLYEMLIKYICKEDLMKEYSQKRLKEEIINTKLALSYLDNNEKLYYKTLKMFYNSYKDIDLKNTYDKALIHTLKGLSGNVGASELSKLLVEFEKNQDMQVLENIDDELSLVLEEIKNILPREYFEIKHEKILIDEEKTKELFKELDILLNSKRPQKINKLVEEIKTYALEKKYEDIFLKVESFTKNYNFKEASEVLNKEFI